jgi:hypothetical protein
MIDDSMYNVWYETYDPNFVDINKKSFVPEKWMSFYPILKKYGEGSIIKPINVYVDALYPKPKLISIEGDTIRLRQENHAEIFLLIKEDGSFRNLDRPWQRQYYQSNEKRQVPDNCFDGVYKFYTPWVIDQNIDIKFESPDEETPFHIYEGHSSFYKIPDSAPYVEPLFVSFSFKNTGKHMVIDKKFGKIKRASPMYDIVIRTDSSTIKRVREFYEHN